MKDQIRDPAVAGLFYPAQPEALRRTVEELLKPLPSGGTTAATLGLVLPHAGYAYSGRVAAAGYRFAAAYTQPDVVVLLGANHTGAGGAVSLPRHASWRTPLGDLPLDREILCNLADMGFSYCDTAFGSEHSMEVHLPFLQVLWRSPSPIVPICVQSVSGAMLEDAGSRLAELLAGRSAWIVASSDFSHYEPEEIARRLDREALEPLLRLDLEDFRRVASAERMSICGVGAISILVSMACTLGLRGAKLLAHESSGDATGDRTAVVGYAAVAFFGG